MIKRGHKRGRVIVDAIAVRAEVHDRDFFIVFIMLASPDRANGIAYIADQSRALVRVGYIA
jgi:hypothetical protein